MKKTKRVAILIATATLACSAIAFSACGGGSDNGVKVSKSEWQEHLTIEVDSYDSLTATDCTYSTYSKEQAAEYGEWHSQKEIQQIDNKAQIYCSTKENETYAPNNSKAVDGFIKTTKITYSFCYNGNYYSWSENDKTQSRPYGVTALTKADFINRIQNVNGQTLTLSAYANPQVYESFKFNDKTKTYEIVKSENMSIGLQFFKDGGVKMINQMTSLERYEISIEKLNSTTITIPQQAYTDVDAYLANK